jgi:putative cell wall-binding protein
MTWFSHNLAGSDGTCDDKKTKRGKHMNQMVVSSTMSKIKGAAKTRVALCVLLVAILALSGLFLAAPAFADESGDTARWIKTYGGSSADEFYSVAPTADGGFVAAGFSYSSDSDLSHNEGDADFAIAKFDASGGATWIRSYGGSGTDRFYSVAPTADGGFVAVGDSASSDGDLSDNKGYYDFVIAKFDASGGATWIKTYGGSDMDRLLSVVPTADGGFVAVGESISPDGDLSDNKGIRDFVIAKFDTSGNLTWIKTYGGDHIDSLASVVSVSDGGFVAVGHSYSLDNDLSSNERNADFVIAKFDENGDVIWIKSYGGSSWDAFSSVASTADGGFVAVGNSASSDGDLSDNKGSNDLIIAKFDENGDATWIKNYGGSEREGLLSVTTTADGGFVATGYTHSSDGDLLGDKGSYDESAFVIIKVDASGNKAWAKTYGGSNFEVFNSVTSTADGGFVMAGYTASSNGDLSPKKGAEDFVIAKVDARGRLYDPVIQLEGPERQQTAARVSTQAYPDPTQVDTVILAYSYDFPDALTASSLAGVLNAPVLLTDTRVVDDETVAELERLRPSTIYIVGGSGVISEDVEGALRAYDFAPAVTRLGGAGREETAYKIACEAAARGNVPTTAFVANAADFPDALSSGSLSASQGVPILLTGTAALDEWARRFLEENNIADVIIVGGPGSVSEAVATQLQGLSAHPTVSRWSGADRYATSADVLNKAIAKWGLSPTMIGLASGEDFPDALVGGAAVGNRGGLLAITDPDVLSPGAAAVISAYQESLTGVEVFGGSGTIRVADQARVLLA